jgi:hypothetical protein
MKIILVTFVLGILLVLHYWYSNKIAVPFSGDKYLTNFSAKGSHPDNDFGL